MLSVLKMSFILLFLTLFQAVATNSYSQSVTISVKTDQAPLTDLFAIIEKQSDFLFFYVDSDVKNVKVSVNATDKSIENILSQALRNTSLKYSIEGRNINVFNKNIVAQQTKKRITGVVKDAEGNAIIGANVVEKGTTNGTITDLDGKYMMEVSSNATLEFSYIGYMTQLQPVGGKNEINVNLKEDTQKLDEVVVVGYGTQTKREITGSITNVTAEDFNQGLTRNAADLLQGKVAGLTINTGSGDVTGNSTIQLRGMSTLQKDQGPLVVIDNVPGMDMSTVNTQDIEAMEILKDGAAAAIYGSVAANGVVIVTTKNGKKGDVKVDFNTFFQFTSAAKKFEMLNADEYLNVHNMMYENAEAKKIGYLTFTDSDGRLKNPTGFDTNWQDEMLRGGLSQNYNVNVRGGSDIAKYSVSYNHSDEKGILRGNKYVQDNARMKLNVQKYIFNFDASLSLKVTQSQQPQYSIKEMYAMAPLVPVYDEDQPSGYGLNEMKVDGVRLELPNNRNVMADDHFKHKKSNGYDLIGNIGLTVDFAPWLKFKTAYAYRGYYTNTKYHSEKFTADVQGQQLYPYNYDYNSYWFEQTFDNVLTFDKTFGKHSLNVMAGSSLTAARKDWSQINVEGKKTVYDVVNGKLDIKDEAAGFFDPTSPTIDAGNGGTFTGNGSFWNYNRASFFGRVNYSYGGKYMLQATVRADGSSKFGKNNRWGVFPSVALGWRISEEEFFSKDIMSNLKLRVSWGRLGNENALGYYYAPTMTNDNTQWMSYIQGGNPWPGMSNLYLVNDDLRWETTDTKNIGVDFGFFNNKLYGSLNYYYNTTEDLLIEKVMPPSAGIYNPTVNVGKMRNKGFELELNYADNINGFEYNVGFNLFTTKNEMLKADPNQILYGSGLKGAGHFVTQTLEGYPVAAFFLYQTDGIFQSAEEVANHTAEVEQPDGSVKTVLLQPNAKPGDIRFKNVNGDGVIDESDKEYCGSGIPKLEANLSFSGSYKGLDLSFLLGSAWGHKLYNANRLYYEAMDSGTNMFKSTLNAWTENNSNTAMPRAVLKDPNMNTRESDRFLEKGNFIRLRQLQLGYTLPKTWTKKVYIDKCRLYVSGENLLTWTNYSGIDPEFSSDILDTGVDVFIFPFTRSYVVGLQVTF